MFNYFKRLFRSNPLNDPTVSITDPRAVEFFSGEKSTSGIVISPENLLSNPFLKMGVELIAKKMAILNYNVYRHEDEGRAKATKHPGHYIVNKCPGYNITPFIWKAVMFQNCITYGNSYSAIRFNDYGNPQDLRILPPHSVSLHTIDGEDYYSTTIDDQPVTLLPHEIIHFKSTLKVDGKLGRGLADVVKDALAVTIARSRYEGVIYKNGANVSYFIELPPEYKMGDQMEKTAKFRDQFMTTHGGWSNWWKPGLLPPGAKAHPNRTSSNAEMELVKSKEFDIKVAAAALGLPSSALNDHSNTSYSSREMDSLILLEALQPWITMAEDEFDLKLLTIGQQEKESHYFETDTKKLIQIDTRTQSEVSLMRYHGGLDSFKEAREADNKSTKKTITDGWMLPNGARLEEEVRQTMELKKKTAEATIAKQNQPQSVPEQPTAPKQDAREKRDVAHEMMLRHITKQTLERLQKRLLNRVEAGDFDLSKHREIISENLESFEKRDEVVNHIMNLQEELDNVLPEQRSQVISRINIDSLINLLM